MPRRVHSITASLVSQSRDAALAAVQVFNSPLIAFKSETFIVLMHVAWTYLLHATTDAMMSSIGIFGRPVADVVSNAPEMDPSNIGICPDACRSTSVL